MAYSKQQWELVANLLLGGHSQAAVAMTMGMTAHTIYDHKKNPKSHLSKLLTEGTSLKPVDFAKSSTHLIAMTAESDKVRLQANNYLVDWDDGDTDTQDDTTKSDAQLRLDIIKDLA